jgi:hypothetical protein
MAGNLKILHNIKLRLITSMLHGKLLLKQYAQGEQGQTAADHKLQKVTMFKM